MKKVMFVVAHPDDETLMGGGFISRLMESAGFEDTAAVVTLASKAEARSTGAGPEKIAAKQKDVFQRMNIKCWNYDGQDSNLINEDHLRMVQFVEKCILEWRPDIIVTHYPLDTHKDHQVASQIVSEAFRILQRPKGNVPCEELWYGEVPSSTDWSVAEQFHPNVWIPLHYDNIVEKTTLLGMYDQVLRPVPHPRSIENITALARVRGAQCGAPYAEAFQQVFRVIQ